jgi:heme exporter protein A
MRLLVENLTRSFGNRRIFGPLSFEVAPGSVLGIAGANGSGKTTLLKVLAGILRPSGGQVRFFQEGQDGEPRSPRDVPDFLGWCAPDLSLYGELTAEENLLFFERVRGRSGGPSRARELLASVGLPESSHSKKVLSALSTGQRQRVKLVFATLHEPAVLLLDEPSSNLDADGVDVVAQIVAAQRRRGAAIVASNDPRDLALADTRISL